MSEAGPLWRLFSPLKILFQSLNILASNKIVFTTIMLLTTLPLSTLIIFQSIISNPRIYQIHHLEALAQFASTRFEARHVWHESRRDAVTLFRIKALFSVPSYLLSLAAAIFAVNSTILATHGITPTLKSAVASFKPNWMRLFVTSIFVYAILFAYSPIFYVLSAISGSQFIVLVIGSGLEVYLMSILSVGIVVSVVEERFGWEAIRIGYDLMEGGRVCGLVLSGIFLLGSSLIGSKMERLMDGRDSLVGVDHKTVMIVCYGFLLLWSYVIMTVFYCDCRKRHPIKEPHQSEDFEEQQLNSLLCNFCISLLFLMCSCRFNYKCKSS